MTHPELDAKTSVRAMSRNEKIVDFPTAVERVAAAFLRRGVPSEAQQVWLLKIYRRLGGNL